MSTTPRREPPAWLRRVVDVRAGEVAPMLWAAAYFFCLLAGYFVLKPVRDEIGAARSSDTRTWLFQATFFVLLPLTPVFGWVFTRLARHWFVLVVYGTALVGLASFYLLLLVQGRVAIWAGNVFFVGLTVFNVCAVSIFWSVLADLLRTEQSRRLYGFIAAGGTLGGLAGSWLAGSLASVIGTDQLLLVAITLLAGSTTCALTLLRSASGSLRAEAPLGGTVLGGLRAIRRSPYLTMMCVYLFLYGATYTVLYNARADVVGASTLNRDERTEYFARIEFWINALTVSIQLFATGRILRTVGVTAALLTLPLVTAAGLGALAFSQDLLLIAGFFVVRQAAHFAVAKPAFETLFTLVDREAKYKSKNFIDTVVFRGGDAATIAAYGAVKHAGLSLSGIALAGVPLALGWAAVAGWLGLRQRRVLSAAPPAVVPGPPVPAPGS